MAKFWAHGTTVTIGGTAIGGLTSIGLPSQARGEVDTSDGDSGGVAEFLPGLLDNGTVELEMRLDVEDSGQQALITNLAGTSTVAIVITLPSTAATTSPVTYSFSAYVAALDGDLAQTGNEAGMRSATLRVSGAITISLGI